MNRVLIASFAAMTGFSAIAQACEPLVASIGLTAAACTPCGPEEIGGASFQEPLPPSSLLGAVLTAQVEVQDFQFSPAALIIPLDAAVNWTNVGARFHTTTSTATPSVWDSGLLNPNDSFLRTFNSLGGFDYECIFHLGMEGTVTVRAPGDATGDNAVNISDFAALAANFNQTGGYGQGNFNLDAVVNISDFAILAANFNRTFSGDLPRGSAVPEPVALMPLSAAGLMRRRRPSQQSQAAKDTIAINRRDR